MLKILYNKTLKLAAHKSSNFYLAIVSFVESSFFPIPPDVMIVPMVIAKKDSYLKIFLIATVFSVLGGICGYLIGYLGAVKPEGKIDFWGRIFGIGSYALPPFWAAMLIQIIFAVLLGWLPIGGRLTPGMNYHPSVTGLLLFDSILN